MQSTILIRRALWLAMFISLAACSKKADMGSSAAPAQAVAPAPAPTQGVASEPVPELADAAMPPAKLAAVSEPGTVATRTGVDRSAQLTSSATTYVDGERKFIRTASANFRVGDVYKSANAIEDVVAGLGGFVIQNHIASRVRQTQRRPISDGKVMELSEYVVEGNVIVRVPSAKTQEFLRAIASQIAFLDKRDFDAHDAQFDMLRKQLEYARNQETQSDLGQATREGGKLEQRVDAINARNDSKAARDEAQIEKKEFEDQVAFSTINLAIYQLPALVQTEVLDVDAVFRQNRPGFFSRVADAGVRGWDLLQDFSIWCVETWPFWIIVLATVMAVLRLRKRKARAAAVKS